jgi:hypothetical protein
LRSIPWKRISEVSLKILRFLFYVLNLFWRWFRGFLKIFEVSFIRSRVSKMISRFLWKMIFEVSFIRSRFLWRWLRFLEDEVSWRWFRVEDFFYNFFLVSFNNSQRNCSVLTWRFRPMKNHSAWIFVRIFKFWPNWYWRLMWKTSFKKSVPYPFFPYTRTRSNWRWVWFRIRCKISLLRRRQSESFEIFFGGTEIAESFHITT